jgi:hypothetical protein
LALDIGSTQVKIGSRELRWQAVAPDVLRDVVAELLNEAKTAILTSAREQLTSL